MIQFNIPPYAGKELEYIKEAMEKNHKICGDGPFTKKCSEWMENKFNVKKVLLTTSCTHATEMTAILTDIKEGDEVIAPSFTFFYNVNTFVLIVSKIVFIYINTK